MRMFIPKRNATNNVRKQYMYMHDIFSHSDFAVELVWSKSSTLK